MASGLGLFLILVGGFVGTIGYETVSGCLNLTANDPLCWSLSPMQNRYASGALGFYVGAVVATLGAILLLSPSVAGLLAKLKGSRPDSGS